MRLLLIYVMVCSSMECIILVNSVVWWEFFFLKRSVIVI